MIPMTPMILIMRKESPPGRSRIPLLVGHGPEVSFRKKELELNGFYVLVTISDDISNLDHVTMGQKTYPDVPNHVGVLLVGRLPGCILDRIRLDL